MTITHYKGKKIPIILIPNSINLPPALLQKTDGIDFSSYSSLSSILYTDALFFYDMVNRDYNKGGMFDLSDIFYSVSEIDSNIQKLQSIESSLSETKLTTAKDIAKQTVKQTFGNLTDNYSMIELLLILSNQFSVSWEREFLIIKAEEFDLSDDTLSLLNDGRLSNNPNGLNRLPILLDNFKKLWTALRLNISYRDLVDSNLSKYHIAICKKQL